MAKTALDECEADSCSPQIGNAHHYGWLWARKPLNDEGLAKLKTSE